MTTADLAERIQSALALAQPDLTTTDVDRRSHGIAPGRYVLIEHAQRIVREVAADASREGAE